MLDTLPTYHLHRAAVTPGLTGRIDQSPWPQLPEVGGLRLLGSESSPAPCETTIKACWDDNYVWVIWHCLDEAVRATYTNRDDPLWEEEVVELFVCPDGNLAKYFEFNFNALGAVFDAMISNPDMQRGPAFAGDTSWDCPGLRWAVTGEGRFNGTAQTDRWWAVEAAIPFAGLDVAAPETGRVWRANLFRIERSEPPQYCTWSPLPEAKPGFHQSDRFGLWVFQD